MQEVLANDPRKKPAVPIIKVLLFVVLFVGLICAPFLVYPVVLMKVFCFALFAAAFNLLLGYAGLLSFGHAAFFGGAAYFTAHAVKVWGWSPETGIIFGALGAGLLGFVIGFIAIKRQGIYFSMITLALSQMFFFFCLQAPFTHGEDGIQEVPRGLLLGTFDLRDNITMYFFVLAVLLLGLAAIYRIIHSPFGTVMRAIRENEPRAISLGYSVGAYKLAAFVISATLAGVAGGTKAIVFQFATLTDVTWQMSGEVILMTLLGGIGTLLGPLIGATLVVALQNYLAGSQLPVTVITGITFMVCVLTFRRGIVGEVLNNNILQRIGIHPGRWKSRHIDAVPHQEAIEKAK